MKEENLVEKNIKIESVTEENSHEEGNAMEEKNNDGENIIKKDVKKDITTRLKRIEGQVKGIENMVEQGKCCRDVLIQIAAIRAAINKVGGLVLENYAKECMVASPKENSKDNTIEDLVSALSMFLK